MIPMTGDAARGKLAADVLDGKVRLLCARTVAEAERCKRDQGHDGLCRSWLDPEEMNICGRCHGRQQGDTEILGGLCDTCADDLREDAKEAEYDAQQRERMARIGQRIYGR